MAWFKYASQGVCIAATAAWCCYYQFNGIQCDSLRASPREEVVILLSGKRYAGKDFVATRIEQRLSAHQILYKRFNHADQMKRIYCDQTGADLQSMLSDRAYKEQHRNAMTKLYQQISSQPGNEFIFCESIYQQIVAESKQRNTQYDVLLIGDFRRKYEEQFYRRHFGETGKVITVRINASEETKLARGWSFHQDKDTHVTECELDDKHDWTFAVDNNGSGTDVLRWIDALLLPSIQQQITCGH